MSAIDIGIFDEDGVQSPSTNTDALMPDICGARWRALRYCQCGHDPARPLLSQTAPHGGSERLAAAAAWQLHDHAHVHIGHVARLHAWYWQRAILPSGRSSSFRANNEASSLGGGLLELPAH